MAIFKILKGPSSRIDLETTPFHEGYAYFTPDDGGFYIDSEVNGEQKRVRVSSNGTSGVASGDVYGTLRANAWVNNQQKLDVEGLAAEQNGFIGVPQDITTTQLDAVYAAKLKVCSQNAGTLTIAANGVVPACDIPVVVVLLS